MISGSDPGSVVHLFKWRKAQGSWYGLTIRQDAGTEICIDKIGYLTKPLFVLLVNAEKLGRTLNLKIGKYISNAELYNVHKFNYYPATLLIIY